MKVIYLWCGVLSLLMSTSLALMSAVLMVNLGLAYLLRERTDARRHIGLASLLLVASAVCAFLSGWGFENFGK